MAGERPTPLRLQALRRLTAILKGVVPANGYYYDLSERVQRGYSVAPIDEAQDSLFILEDPEPKEFNFVGGSNLQGKHEFGLLLQGWPKDDQANPSDPAHTMAAEVEHRLSRITAEKPNGRGPIYEDDFLLGIVPGTERRYLSSFKMAPAVIRPPEDQVSRLAMFYLPVILEMNYDLGNPFEGDE